MEVNMGNVVYGDPEKKRLWTDGLGRKWGYRERECCLFCTHCTDIFYDATNGPYMFTCDRDYEMGTEECERYFEQEPKYDGKEF